MHPLAVAAGEDQAGRAESVHVLGDGGGGEGGEFDEVAGAELILLAQRGEDAQAGGVGAGGEDGGEGVHFVVWRNDRRGLGCWLLAFGLGQESVIHLACLARQ